MNEPKSLTVWQHLKTDSYYTVLGVSECSTNGSEGGRIVVYLSHERLTLHHRDVGEFMDGRFAFTMNSTPIRGAKMLMKLRDEGGVR